jgi:hypothetical protein
MTSFKTQLVLQLLSVYSVVYDVSHIFISKTVDFYNYIVNYIYGYNDTWVFIKGYDMSPIPLSYVFNKVEASAYYNNNTTTLEVVSESNNTGLLTQYKISWLSAKIRVKNRDWVSEFEIDDFLQKFRLNTFKNHTLSLLGIYTIWCIYSKQWFVKDDRYPIEFIIIDDMGDEHILNINDTIYLEPINDNNKKPEDYENSENSENNLRDTPELPEPALSEKTD